LKTRNGFVSNSSSSSFIVIRKDNFEDGPKMLITPEEEKALMKYGFKKVGCFYAEQVPNELYMVRKPPTKKYLKMLKRLKIPKAKKEKNLYFNYGYDITCNQDDVIYFLLKKNISFEAVCHYGHETVIFKKNCEHFLMIENFGVQASASNWRKNYDKMLEWGKGKEVVTKVKVKDFIKREDSYRKAYNENT
jgi:hypothetical protein